MADTTTGLPVQTLAGQFVSIKLVDTGGTNVASVSAANALKVDGSAVTQPVSAASLPLPTGAATSALQSNVQVVDNAGFTDGTTTLLMQGYIFDDVAGTALTENDAAAARIDSKRAVVFVGEDATTRAQKWSISAAGALAGNLTQIGGNTLVTGGVNGTLAVGGVLAHDAAAAAALPVGIGFFASAAAPTDVSADGDATKAWSLRNGSQVVNLAAGGTLVTFGQKTMANAFSVSIASDQSAVASNITQVSGATQSATNPLFVRLTDGTSAYTASSIAPTLPKFSTKTSSALGAGSSVDLTHYVTSGKTGQLMGIDVGATVPLKVIINTELTASKTTRVVLFTQPFVTYQWRAPFKTFITQASADSTSGFSVTIKNLDAAVAADVYSTGFWDEV